MAEPGQELALDKALMRHAEQIRAIQAALLDAYVVVGVDQRVAAFNRPFFVLFPRRVARTLEGKPLSEVLTFRFNEALLDPVAECLERGAGVRFDEIEGQGPGESRFHFIVSASPLVEGERSVGVLLLLRDVTDEVNIQSKYQNMLHEEARARAELEEVLRKRTRELLEAHDALNTTQGELMEYAKGQRLPQANRLTPGGDP